MAVFKKALIDPSLAEKLMDMARTTKPDSLAQKAAEFVKPYLGPAGVAATTEEKPPAPEPKKRARLSQTARPFKPKINEGTIRTKMYRRI